MVDQRLLGLPIAAGNPLQLMLLTPGLTEPSTFLYREFLFRIVDMELLSTHAQGDSRTLLGQFASLLIFIRVVLALFGGLWAAGVKDAGNHRPPVGRRKRQLGAGYYLTLASIDRDGRIAFIGRGYPIWGFDEALVKVVDGTWDVTAAARKRNLRRR